MRSDLDALKSLQRFFAGILPEPWDVRRHVEAGDPPQRPYALVEFAGDALTTGSPAMQTVAIPFAVGLFLEKQATRALASDAALAMREQVWQAVKWGVGNDRHTTDRIPLFAYEARNEVVRFSVMAGGGTWRAILGAHTSAPIAFDAAASVVASTIATALGVMSGMVVGHDRGAGLWDIEFDLAGASPGTASIDGASLTGGMVATRVRQMLAAAAAPWRGDRDYMAVASLGMSTVHDEGDATLVMVPVDLRLTFTRGLPLPLERRILQRINAASGIA